MLRVIIAALAIPATAAAGDYSDNPARTLFEREPCKAALDALDGHYSDPATTASGDAAAMIAVRIGGQGAAWGFIVGYDTAKGGLWDGDTTTLERFKAACAANPDATGLEILGGL